MTDNTEDRSRFIRARQRDRAASIVGFSANLSPAIEQVGIDKLEVSVAGHWICHSGNGEAMFRNRLAFPDVQWFNTPQASPQSMTVSMSRSRNGSTITECKVRIASTRSQQGTININLSVNPTRTLAHLLARFGNELSPAELWSEIASLSPVSFFAKAEAGLISSSLDGSDNWLPATRYVRDRLGGDPWEHFLPIYVDRLRVVCNALLMEALVDPANEPTNRVPSPMGDVSLHWGDVRVSSVETYFERYHRHAISTVRRGGNALLAADHSVDFWRYLPAATSFHRENARFSVSMKLPGTRRLAIYAKLRDRLRFEIRRKGKGDYSRLASPTDGNMRLLGILEQERRALLGAVEWEAIGELFAGPDHPEIADIETLIEQVCASCGQEASFAAEILNRLLFDGAITEADVPRAIIGNLRKRGIVDRQLIRVRDINGRTKRFALTAPYRDVHLAIVDGFNTSSGRS
ncbi:hypothetical protein [Sphingopyxis fribergensis]